MKPVVVFKVTLVIPPNEIRDKFIISNDTFGCISNFQLSIFENKVFDIDVEKFCHVLSFPSPTQSSDVVLNNCWECYQSVAFMKFTKPIKVKIDVFLMSLVLLEIKNSRTFRKNFLRNFYSHITLRKKCGVCYSCSLCQKCNKCYHIFMFVKPPNKDILDLLWNRRVQVLVNERCELENAMAWLSTLGGAFSALGDTFIECAEKAGAISIQQLRIALRLGDPLTVCHCKIYLAMSLLQRGYFKKTKLLIRELYKFSTEGLGAKDFRLKNMCIAVWNKLKYLKSLGAIKAELSK